MQLNTNANRVMESGNHFKNGASLKCHTIRGNFLRIALTITVTLFAFVSFGQNADIYGDPKKNERVIGNVQTTITIEVFHSIEDFFSAAPQAPSYDEAYSKLLAIAKINYPNKVIDLRNISGSAGGVTQSKFFMNVYDNKKRAYVEKHTGNWLYYPFHFSVKVVEIISSKTIMNEALVKTLDKVLSNVRAGSRLAIDQISVSGDFDRTTVNDQLIDILLDKSYRVVAKEYLEKLREEQEEQQGGGFNERTTARTDNFSGVGYFLNVRVNEQSIRIQVINVSTGEYEGNATIDF